MMKIMIDIAVDLENPRLSEIMQGYFYDIENRPILNWGFLGFYVEKGKHLSDAQLKISPFVSNFAHPSPEELSIISQNC